MTVVILYVNPIEMKNLKSKLLISILLFATGNETRNAEKAVFAER